MPCHYISLCPNLEIKLNYWYCDWWHGRSYGSDLRLFKWYLLSTSVAVFEVGLGLGFIAQRFLTVTLIEKEFDIYFFLDKFASCFYGEEG